MGNLGTIVKELAGNLGPQASFRCVTSNLPLVKRLVRREIEARYRGSILGMLWAFLVPMLLLGVYTFVFSVVFAVRWETNVESRAHFALVLFCGLLLYNVFNECLSRAPSLMLAHSTYIKKVIFPLEILPWVTLFAAIVNAAIGFSILLIGYLFILGSPPWTVLAVPFICLPILCLTVGLSLFLSSIGVFVRDAQQFVGILMMVVLFMTPIFYPLSAVPVDYQWVATLNPLAITIEQIRDALFRGILPDSSVFLILLAASVVTLWLGHFWFMKTKKGFADVI
jgi:lipopolysaccharide transport system permease protein